VDLQEFFAALDRMGRPVPIDRLVALEEQLDVTLADLGEHVRYGEECYRRNLLHEGAGYQAWVLCWKPGQKSPIHDHRGSACGVKVVSGTVTETVFSYDGTGVAEGETRLLPEGGVCGSYDTDIHEIANRGSKGLVTLHVYTPPLATMGIYSRQSAEVVAWSP